MSTNVKNTTWFDCITKTKEQTTCPDCGALECLCRPRFFAGQLLTEQDLNLLDQYIKKKNRLQNRNLHGWGVVNGLIVLCDPCDQIKVTKGYALSPCGDDIVVCQDTAVDICALIRKCKERERQDWECQPFQRPPNSDCRDLEEDWVLTIRYCEQPSRGMTALRSVDCTCGNRNPSGCNQEKEKKTQTPRGAPAQCEPTVVCEGFAFDVYRKPEPEDPKDGQDNEGNTLFSGPLIDRFMCCFNGLMATFPVAPPGDFQSHPTEWAVYCCQLKENLIAYFYSQPTLNCQFIVVLNTIVCPDPQDNDFVARMDEISTILGLVFLEAMYDCLCLALLPLAPEATDDPRVPLAVVTVRARDCKVLRICSWTVLRKMLITWPAIGYWSSLLPIGQWLREGMEQICCNLWTLPIFRRLYSRGMKTKVDAAGHAAATDAQPMDASVRNAAILCMNPQLFTAKPIDDFTKLASLSAARGEGQQDPWAFLNSVSRAQFATDAEGLAGVEKSNVAHFLMFHQLVRPMAMAALKPEHVANLLKPTGVPVGTPDKSAAAMSERLAALEKKLKTQASAIKSLQAKLKK